MVRTIRLLALVILQAKKQFAGKLVNKIFKPFVLFVFVFKNVEQIIEFAVEVFVFINNDAFSNEQFL